MLKLKPLCFGHLMRRADSFEKTLMLGKIEGGRRRAEDEMVGWHHRLEDVSLNKPRKIAQDRDTWYAAVCGVAESCT